MAAHKNVQTGRGVHGEEPTTLPMAREVAPLLGGVLEIPEGVRYVRLAIYAADDLGEIAGSPGRTIQMGRDVSLVVDCLSSDDVGVGPVTSIYASAARFRAVRRRGRVSS